MLYEVNLQSPTAIIVHYQGEAYTHLHILLIFHRLINVKLGIFGLFQHNLAFSVHFLDIGSVLTILN